MIDLAYFLILRCLKKTACLFSERLVGKAFDRSVGDRRFWKGCGLGLKLVNMSVTISNCDSTGDL